MFLKFYFFDYKNLTKLKEKVLEVNADLGIGYDGDGDRCLAVDENGNIIGRTNELERLAYNEKGEVIGIVSADGTVKDFNGKVIGKVDANGNIIDEKGNYCTKKRFLMFFLKIKPLHIILAFL